MSAYVTRNSLDDPNGPRSSRNVSRLSTYELRQELVRRNKLDIPEDEINHKTMLQRLIKLLLEDEEKAVNDKEALLEAERVQKLNEAKAERERKKQEALERSKQRQQNPDYFRELAESNKLPEKTDLTHLEEVAPSNDSEAVFVSDDDPFRSISSKQKSKIYIK